MNFQKLMRITPGLIGFVLLFWIQPVFSEEEGPSVGNLFIQAYNEQDEATMKSLIKTRAEEVPGEVQAMVQYSLSPDASQQEQDFLFNIAGMMSQMYGEVTGDERLLNAVKSNYITLMDRRKSSALPPNSVKKVKDDLLSLGKGDWRIMVFKLNSNKELIVEIEIRESSGGESLTPTIDFRTGNKAKEIVKNGLPNIKAGKIVWSSIGIGLKTVFLN
ncbi:MAG: hypothetical protein ACE5EN_00490 [Nitrospinota bacterium]